MKKAKKSEETKEKEKIVPSFFDIFADKDTKEEDGFSISLHAQFFRDEFIPGALENYLELLTLKSKENIDEEIEEEEEEEEKPKKKTKGKRYKKKDENCKNQ